MQPDRYVLLMDPDGDPDGAVPPIETVVGLWPLGDDGAAGRFRPNPDYVPRASTAATDPLDAVLRRALSGLADAEHLQLVLRATRFAIGMTDGIHPVIAHSPDDVPCVVVATSAAHRTPVEAPAWREGDLADLVQLLADGVDILINPDSPGATRLTGDFIRETMMLSDEDLAAEGGGR